MGVGCNLSNCHSKNPQFLLYPLLTAPRALLGSALHYCALGLPLKTTVTLLCMPAAQGSQDSMREVGGVGWERARCSRWAFPRQPRQCGREGAPTRSSPSHIALRNPEPQAEVCKTLPGVIAGYTEQSEELKTYFHCIIKTCKGREAVVQGSTWPWIGEHLALGLSSLCCIFWSRDGTGHAAL